MSSIIKSVFQATVGQLIKKGRDLVAEKLREGDVADERFRSLIVRELDDIKSKLDSIAKKDLLSSVSFFKEGLVLAFEMFNETTADTNGADTREGTLGTSRGSSGLNGLPSPTDGVDGGGKIGLNFPEELEKIQRSRGDNSTTRWLSRAQTRFQDSRRKATDAFVDKALNTLDRVLAMQYRVMATILEAADNPREALPTCKLCLEELHAMPAVQKNFKAALKPGKRFFPMPSSAKDERERGMIISTVVYINKIIYDVKQMVGETAELLFWPCVETGEEKVDPLRDVRVAEILRKQDMMHRFVPTLIGLASSEREQRIILPRSIASTKKGHFIVAESGDNDIKVFDRSGKYLSTLEYPDEQGLCNILDVAADQGANVYVLASRKNYGSEVCVFSKAGDFDHRFVLKNGFRYHKMTVVDSKIFVLVEEEDSPLLKSPGKANLTWIHVYNSKGVLVESFPDRCQRSCDVIATTHGRVMVLDNLASCVNSFSTMSDNNKGLHQFKVSSYPEAFAFHEESKQIIIASVNSEKRLKLSMYSQDGKFERSVELDVKLEANSMKGIAVNKEGRVAMIYDKTVLVV